MKKQMWKLSGVVVSLTALALTGCSGDGKQTSGDGYRVGITQLLTHPSLDAARDGFKQAIADADLSVTYDEQNAQGDQSVVTSIANKFANEDLDLILAVSTTSAQTTSQLIQDTPILFTAVTDPAAAGLVEDPAAPGGNVTGTTDMNPVDSQITLLTQLKPSIKTVGIVYSSGEVNSAIQVDMAKETATALGLTVVEKTVSNASEITQAVEALGDVDAIYVPTDNTVVGSLEVLVQKAQADKIPMVCGESDSLSRGCLATQSIDYEQLGYQTGQMAAKILQGEAEPATLAVEAQEEFTLFINKTAASAIGLEVPEDLLAQAEIVE